MIGFARLIRKQSRGSLSPFDMANDVTTEQLGPVPPKPRTLRICLYMMAADFLFSSLFSILLMPPLLQTEKWSPMLLSVLLSVSLFIFLLIYKTAEGDEQARVYYSVLSILWKAVSMIVVIFPAREYSAAERIAQAMVILYSAAVLVLLWRQESTAWFREIKSRMSSQHEEPLGVNRRNLLRMLILSRSGYFLVVIFILTNIAAMLFFISFGAKGDAEVKNILGAVSISMILIFLITVGYFSFDYRVKKRLWPLNRINAALVFSKGQVMFLSCIFLLSLYCLNHFIMTIFSASNLFSFIVYSVLSIVATYVVWRALISKVVSVRTSIYFGLIAFFSSLFVPASIISHAFATFGFGPYFRLLTFLFKVPA
jgi:hypothetical protein